MTNFIDLNKAYREEIISSREYVDMAEWFATADDREDPDDVDLVNLLHALEDGVLSPTEYVYMADFLFEWLQDRLAVSAGEADSTSGGDEPVLQPGTPAIVEAKATR